jgi:hypothetical protein
MCAQARMAGLPPEQRQYVMQQQQLVIAQMQSQVPYLLHVLLQFCVHLTVAYHATVFKL